MSKTTFNRDTMARWYAARHLKTDPGTQAVYYLPAGAPDREIRFIEVNELIAERGHDPLEPLDFGVDTSGPEGHTLMVLDMTPAQWAQVNKKKIQLPSGWSLEGAVVFPRKKHE